MYFTINTNKKSSYQVGILSLALGVLTLRRKGIIEYSDFWDCVLELYPLSKRNDINLNTEISHFLNGFDELFHAYSFVRSKKELVSLHKKEQTLIFDMIKKVLEHDTTIKVNGVDWLIEYDYPAQMLRDQHEKRCTYKYSAYTVSSRIVYKYMNIMLLGLLVLYKHNIIPQKFLDDYLFKYIPINMQTDSMIGEYINLLLLDVKGLIRLSEDYPLMFIQEYTRTFYRVIAIHEFILWKERVEKPLNGDGGWHVSFTEW